MSSCVMRLGFLGFESFCDTNFDFEVQSRTMAGQFSAHIWTSITFGLIIAFPIRNLYQFWKFISPGLCIHKEKNSSRGFIFISSILFFIGVSIWLLHCLPVVHQLFRNLFCSRPQVHNDFDLNSYIGLIRASTLASGLIFELPIIIYFLTKIGLVTPEFLTEKQEIRLGNRVDFCRHNHPS